jgi:hypothetical protein
MASPAPVPYSQLQPYKYYIVPPPSDEARFITSRSGPPDYLKQQRRLLLDQTGRQMQVADKGERTWSAQVRAADGKKIIYVYFDESSFPPGQMFQEVSWNWKPTALAPLPADPWDEFIHPRDKDLSDYDEETEDKKFPLPKIKDVLSKEDIAAQKQFGRTLTRDEKRVLNAYKRDAYSFVGPLMLGNQEHSLAAVDYAQEATAGLPKERAGPGFIPEFMGAFTSVLFKAPKLTREINVFRGIDGSEALNMPGTMALSTSYDKYTAADFSPGAGECCILKINVKPGIRIIALDLLSGLTDNPISEREILICPPYKAQIEDVGNPDSGVKKVTLTPVKYRGGTRRRRRLRQSKKRTSTV